MPRNRSAFWWRSFAIAASLLMLPITLVGAQEPRLGSTPSPVAVADAPTAVPFSRSLEVDEESEEELLAQDTAFLTRRLAGDRPISIEQASAFRAAAVKVAKDLRKNGVPVTSAAAFNAAWSALGPNPIGEIPRSETYVEQMNGRIGALAIRSNGDWILGGAQGGIWIFRADGTSWEPKTDDLSSLAIGALALAPSDDSIVYAGTGEGALSGDSYYGNGVMKSTDGGRTWAHVSGDYFTAVSISRIVVDPGNADHLYAAVLRGRGGARRTSPSLHSKFGIWESKDGAATWTLIDEAPKGTNGATDLEMDPQQPTTLYASFWGDAVYKSTDGGRRWATSMSGLPSQNNAANLTRFSISISHPAGADAVLYAGTDFIDGNGHYQQSRVFRSDDGAASWHELPTTGFAGSDDSVLDYCGQQCFYDNVIEADPNDANVVYAAGQFAYAIHSGGIFRSDDGGQHWKNLGWNQHPDFHAFAFDPNNSDAILSGSDGGVWYSDQRGGRMPGDAAEADVTAAVWYPVNAYGLQIAQFTSIATNPSFFLAGQAPRERVWGGTQDNGTLRKSTLSQTWFDMFSGDGGQVLVDPTDWHYVYGTYYGISPYRATDGGGGFFTNQYIRGGIDLTDRSDFYAPWVLNKDNPNQLFLGTQRLYRTNNAKAPSSGDVHWTPISGDLTSGCGGTAPNGARNCSISAIGIGGGDAVYTGSLDGYVYLSTDAKSSAHPTWTRIDQTGLPKRPVAQIAVDRSNYRIAYFAYNGFNAATPGRPGHVFMTKDGGNTVLDISGNLPDVPVNSIIVDPSYANTLYAGTDVGAFVTYDRGLHWAALGSGLPIVAIWQMDFDGGAPAGANGVGQRTLLAGTHGRGAFRLTDSTAIGALQVSKVDAGLPVGPSSNLAYTITVKNIGNATATGIAVSDQIPANTSFVSAADGGTRQGGKVTWSGLSIAPGASANLHFTVSIAAALKNKVTSIVNDGIVVTSAEGPGATGSPTITNIAPAYSVSVSPSTQTDGGRAGDALTYLLTLANGGYNADSYTISQTGATFPTSFFQADCTTALTTTTSVPSGGTTQVCVKVEVPAGAANEETSTAHVTATSTNSPATTAGADVVTIAVTADVLLVDNDGNIPDVQGSYQTALTSAGVAHSTWDLKADSTLPMHYLNAHRVVIWFTGNSYPGPVLPYEDELAAFLDGGGKLFMNGQDILDQAAGTTDFVHDYLHIDWDGTDAQNDLATAAVNGVTGNPVTDGIGAVPLDHSVLGATFEDQITPIGPAVGAFTDDAGKTDALNVDTGTYQVVFLAFPMEAYGTATDKVDLVNAVMSYFGY